jgi:hypothetical protein
MLHCGLGFWLAATEGLPAKPAGPGSEQLRGGIGALSYDGMREYLRHLRVYLYTGTTPASYTLGLIEAMLSGVPVVSLSGKAWAGPDELFEGDAIVKGWDTPAEAAKTQAPARPTAKEREPSRAHGGDCGCGRSTRSKSWAS